MKRRDFVKTSLAATTALSISPWLRSNAPEAAPAVVSGSGDDPHTTTLAVIAAMGGMKTFISKGDVVMLKPNIGWNRKVEQAACTNPEVLRALAETALDAGAKKVIVMDRPCHKAEDTYSRSGIEEMARKLGLDVRHTDDNRLVMHDFKGEYLQQWPVYRDFLEVDKFINVPILKHHGSAELTIAMKNLYGILGGRRGKLHRNMGGNIADLAHGFTSHLVVVDAWRILLRNGPVGGRLSDVEEKKTVIASTNILEADTIAAELFGRIPAEVPFIRAAHELGMGRMDPAAISVKRVAA
ncbi:MAG TPA: DUF362 domain-containing protein [Candidatus Aminicenantes bacterium]|nr:DUF362 domain-containing protein [Candidatus Aminicenantes bacterium]